jgi:ribosome-interacting GTPase 1
LLGPPNTGKSELHTRLTGSGAHVAPYPFTTQYPEPGMMPYEDVHFQLVDLPAVSPEHPVSWLANALQTADACLLVIDLGDPACVERVDAVHAVLREKRVTLTEHWQPHDQLPRGAADTEEDPFALRLPTVLLANKADAVLEVQTELRTFLELAELRYPALTVSSITGQGLADVGALLFRLLGIVRVYTKLPGRPPDRHRPFTIRHGQTVDDIARLVHKEVAVSLKYARVWGKSGFDGQHVGREHQLADGDVVELHV